jgi:hypothetical protein
MDDDADETVVAADEPVVEALLAIARELRGIRVELAEQHTTHDDADETRGVEMLECRSCGTQFPDTATAREHALCDHGAPTADWQTLYPSL